MYKPLPTESHHRETEGVSKPALRMIRAARFRNFKRRSLFVSEVEPHEVEP